MYPKRFSRAREEFFIAFLVVHNPSVDGFLWNISNWRQVLIRCTEPRQEKSNQLFLLLDRQNIGGLLDLKE